MPAWFPGGREWHDQDRGHRGSGKAERAVVRDLQRLRVEPLVPVAPGTALTAVPQMELLAVIDGAAGRGGWALTDGTGSSAATVLVDLDRRRLEVTVGDPGTPFRSLAAELQPRRRHQLRGVPGRLAAGGFVDREVALTTRAYLPGGGFAAAVFETTGGIRPAAIGGWRLAADAIGEQDR